MTLADLKPGLRHSETLTVSEALSVPAQAQHFDPHTEMPPVFATAQMIAFVEWTCVLHWHLISRPISARLAHGSR